MQKGEIDKTLARMFRGGALFAPDLADTVKGTNPTREQPRPTRTAFSSIYLPIKGQVYEGRRLLYGPLSLHNVAPDHALIIMTTDFNLIHIDPNGFVTSRQSGSKVLHGQIDYDVSSLILEKNKPFTLTLYHPQTDGIVLFSPSTPISDMIMYYPQPTSQERIHYSRRQNSTKLSSPLLYKFMK